MRQAFAFAAAEFLRGNIDLTAEDRIYCYAVDQSFYVANLATDKYLSSVSMSGRIGFDPDDIPGSASPVVLEMSVADSGVIDCEDFEFVNISGPACDALLYVYKPLPASLDSGTVLLWWETESEGLPTAVLDESTISVQIDDGPNKFGRLQDLLAA